MCEGRYALQCFSCHIGQIHLYKLLTLPRRSRAFFVVADPPKVTWTTNYVADYLLSGSRQRLHVTLLNGPGVIEEGAVLQLTSQSGLVFHEVVSSSIEVFPLERNSTPREAEMSIAVEDEHTRLSLPAARLSLPACRPFERVSLFFDVVSPVNDEFQESMNKHEVGYFKNSMQGRLLKHVRVGWRLFRGGIH